MSPEKQSVSLHAPLSDYVRQYEDLKRDARRLTEGLSETQFNWQPTPERWSIAQCLEHLNAVALPYTESLALGIAEARRRGEVARGVIRYSFIERWMIRSLEPPPRRRLPAPGMFRPEAAASSSDPAAVMSAYLELKDRFIELLVSADGLDIGKRKIATPVSKFIRLRIGAAFAFLASHERRHLWQARQVRESHAFPDDHVDSSS